MPFKSKTRRKKFWKIGTGFRNQAGIFVLYGSEKYTPLSSMRCWYNRTAEISSKKSAYQVNHYCGDGSQGPPAQAPFDKIHSYGRSHPTVPKNLIKAAGQKLAE